MNQSVRATDRFQFGLKSVFALTTVVAILVGLGLIVAPTLARTTNWLWIALGAVFVVASAAWQIVGRRGERRLAALSLVHAALCLYLPFAWLVLIDYPWTSYRVSWLLLWPILPGFLPGAYFFHPHGPSEFTTMGIATALLLGIGAWIHRQGRIGVVVTTLLLLLISVPSAMLAYAAFRA